MRARHIPQLTRLLAALLFVFCAITAQADTPASLDSGSAASAVLVAQAEAPAAPTAESAPPAPETTPAAPKPEELPRMTNKAAAFWGVAFMLSVCLAFTTLAGWAIYKGHGTRGSTRTSGQESTKDYAAQ